MKFFKELAVFSIRRKGNNPFPNCCRNPPIDRLARNFNGPVAYAAKEPGHAVLRTPAVKVLEAGVVGNLDPKQAYPSRPNRFPILASVYIS